MSRSAADAAPRSLRVCFVCLGNICRSPTAEAVLRRRIADAGLEGRIEVDSAGTGAWHVGDPPDPRATAEGRRRGLALSGRARQFEPTDFDACDLVVAMDRENAADLRALAPDDAAVARIRLLRSFDPAVAADDGAAGVEPVEPADLDVPDPYYRGPHGFADVFDLVDAACAGLLDHLVEQLAANGVVEP